MTADLERPVPVESARDGWLVAELCENALYNGWHLYLRDTDRHQRNADGSWGWLRRGNELVAPAHAALAELGILMRRGGDGTCDDDGYAELARRHPIRKSRSRGGVAIRIAGSSITLLAAQCGAIDGPGARRILDRGHDGLHSNGRRTWRARRGRLAIGGLAGARR